MTDLAVIMSVYRNDRLSFVTESVQSILNQTFSRFHYYIFYDGPVAPDIDIYLTSLNDERIRIFRSEKNGGLAAALNFLLDIVLKNREYKIIARMDADDISAPSRFEKQRNFLSDHRDISVVGCWYEEIDEKGRHIRNIKLPSEHEALKKRYYTRTPFAHPAVMFRRNLIEIAGSYPNDTILMEDNVLWGRALKHGLKFANIPESLLKFRIDRDFYKRRSGIKYGWNYIITRTRINRSLNSPFYAYIFSIFIGFIKMMPSGILEKGYSIFRKT